MNIYARFTSNFHLHLLEIKYPLDLGEMYNMGDVPWTQISYSVNMNIYD